MSRHRIKLVIAASAALVAEILAPSFNGIAHAAPPPPFASAFLRLDRMEALTPTGGMVCVTTNDTTTTPLLGTEASVDITFPTQAVGTDFVVNATASNWTVSTAAGLYGTSLAWPGIGTASNVTGHTVTFPSGALAASSQYCFTFSATNTLTNGTVGGSTDELTGDIQTLDGTTPTPNIVNQTNYAVAVITNDQIAVSAIVPPEFIFTISGNTDAFINELNPTAIESTTGVSYGIITNAKGGWITWVKDSQQGLYSPTANYTIDSVPYNTDAPTILSASGTSEGYGMFATIVTDAAGGCTVNTDPEYTESGASAADEVGQLAAGYLPDATCTGAPPATDNGSTVKLTERASIAGGTPAGSDYADIITVTAAGNF
jgi:hypothetical protein